MTLTHADVTGSVKEVQRRVQLVPLPSDAEELRAKYKAPDNCFLYAQYKYPTTGWLADCRKGTHGELADYLLGSKVLKMRAMKDMNRTVDWSVIIRYEFEIRKKAMELVKDEGYGLSKAIRAACQDE